MKFFGEESIQRRYSYRDLMPFIYTTETVFSYLFILTYLSFNHLHIYVQISSSIVFFRCSASSYQPSTIKICMSMYIFLYIYVYIDFLFLISSESCSLSLQQTPKRKDIKYFCILFFCSYFRIISYSYDGKIFIRFLCIHLIVILNN